MSDKDEIEIYHIVCDLSKICRDYFYERKYLHKGYWSVDDVVLMIEATTKELNKKYNEIKKKTKKSN